MRHQVLDHGYVEFIEAWGQGESGAGQRMHAEAVDFECGIIEAARQSTQGSFRGWEQDQRLLAFLFNSNPQHATPFEFAGMVIEVQAPIFVFREWHRHRTQSYNEASARYAPLPDLCYAPDPANVHQRADAAYNAANKQQASLQPPDHPQIDSWLQEGEWLYDKLEEHYQRALLIGVPKEIARVRMPVGHYSRMRSHANLRNWLGFMALRDHPKAQWEIQQYAKVVGEILAQKFPRTFELFEAARA